MIDRWIVVCRSSFVVQTGRANVPQPADDAPIDDADADV